MRYSNTVIFYTSFEGNFLFIKTEKTDLWIYLMKKTKNFLLHTDIGSIVLNRKYLK